MKARKLHRKKAETASATPSMQTGEPVRKMSVITLPVVAALAELYVWSHVLFNLK